jgi:hypothetical protein
MRSRTLKPQLEGTVEQCRVQASRFDRESEGRRFDVALATTHYAATRMWTGREHLVTQRHSACLSALLPNLALWDLSAAKGGAYPPPQPTLSVSSHAQFDNPFMFRDTLMVMLAGNALPYEKLVQS